jgi:hypothetical protein
MPRPRTKFQKLHETLAEQPDWGRDCRECQSFWEWWKNWGPKKRRRTGTVGRPRFLLEPQSLHQAALYCAIYVSHLREMQRTPDYGASRHLTENHLDEWVPAVEVLRPYFRYNDAAWGEPGVISVRRWKKDVQYQAVRRLLADRLEVDEKTLGRRFDELALWGPTVVQLNAVRRLLAARRPEISRESLLQRLKELELALRGPAA